MAKGGGMNELDRLTEAVFRALDEKKGERVLIIDVRGRCDFADRFVIASGTSKRHLKALADAVIEAGERMGLCARVEGLAALEWVLVDLSDLVVHIFLPEVREAFQLERLWGSPEDLASDTAP